MAITVGRTEPRHQKAEAPMTSARVRTRPPTISSSAQNAALVPLDDQASPLAAVHRTARNASAQRSARAAGRPPDEPGG